MRGFFDLYAGHVGKSLTAIRSSKSKASSILALFGGRANVPTSVMRAARRTKKDPKVDEPSVLSGYDATAPGMAKYRDRNLPAELREAYKISGRGCEQGALSTFPQNIGRSMVLLYTDPGTIVFDPFAGHNSRMDLCVAAGRHYVGCDVSAKFMEFNRRRAKALRRLYPRAEIHLHETDSRSVPVASASADFTITSPPYYDIEDYGDEPAQLGKAPTYRKFLQGIGAVLNENFRVLRPGAYSVWFVNDFRRDGRFHIYHADVVHRAESCGFVLHDLLIVDLGHSIRDCFTNQILLTRIIPKRHEYGLVFRKPEVKGRVK